MKKIVRDNTPERSEIFETFANKITLAKSISGLEHVDDLQMELIIIMMDALIENKTITLSDEKLEKYNKIKDQWNATKSVDLSSETYEIDYAFNGDGKNGNPNGLKRIARESQKEYKNTLQSHGYKI